MPPRRWSQLWNRTPWLQRLSATTLSPSEAARGVDAWISSLPVSPVSPGARAAKGSALPMSAGSGRSSRESFATFDRQSSSWKTSRPSLFAEASDPFSDPWPYAGSMRSGICSARPTSAHRKSGSGSSSWASPTAMNASGSGYQYASGNHDGPVLTLVGQSQQWPTPLASQAKRRKRTRSHGDKRGNDTGSQALNWSTPTARDWKDGSQIGETPTNSLLGRQVLRTPMPGDESLPCDPTSRQLWSSPRAGAATTSRRPMFDRTDGKGGGSMPSLEQQATGEVLVSASRKKLNPNFVEWLMGLPLGLTACAPVAMASYRSRQRQLLWSLLADWGFDE